MAFDGEWIKDIKIEELPKDYQEVAAVVGVEGAIRLSDKLGGLPFYFPKIEGLIEKKRNEMIRKEFDGQNYRELAKKYRLTEVWIRQIVDHKKDDRQIELL